MKEKAQQYKQHNKELSQIYRKRQKISDEVYQEMKRTDIEELEVKGIGRFILTGDDTYLLKTEKARKAVAEIDQQIFVQNKAVERLKQKKIKLLRSLEKTGDVSAGPTSRSIRLLCNAERVE
jgi:uncharacterized protein (UPF0297 family)